MRFKMSHRAIPPHILSFLLLNFFTETLLAQIDFELLTTRRYFIDKSGLIEEFLKSNDTRLMVCATRKFGKSVNLDMLKRFLQIEVNETTGIPLNKTESSGYRLFTNSTLNLEISHNKDLIQDHLGEYPTILLDFASSKINSSSGSFDHMLDLIRTDISNCFKPFQWLCDELERRHGKEENTTKQAQIQFMRNAVNMSLNAEQMRTSVYNLSEILYEYFDNKSVMVLVDEVTKSVEDFSVKSLQSKSLLAVNDLIGNILYTLMKPYDNTTHLARVFIAGTSKTAFEGYKNPFLKKNVKVLPFLRPNPFNSYYGFNDTEVTKLCDRYNLTEDQRKGLKDVYMGESYAKGKTNVRIFNPFLVMKFLKNIIKPDNITVNKGQRFTARVDPAVQRWLGNDSSF